jgi:thioredoxin reductase (NADPH)
MVSTNLNESSIYDTIIIGGGPAGISNAIHLGFHLRKVIIVDRKSSAMNFHTNPVNNYPGVKPLCTGIEILNKMREELSEYRVQNFTGNVIKIEGEFPEFKIHVTPLNETKENDQKTMMSRTLVFATGTARKHPLVKGDWRNWLPFAGKNEISYYCPDCEAPLTLGKDIIIVNAGTVNSALYIAKCIEPYAKKIRIFMTEDGYIPFTKKDQEVLDNSKYDWVRGFIEEINIEKPGEKQKLVTSSDAVFQCEHFFVSWTNIPRSELAVEIGVEVDSKGNILTDHRGKTNIEGVWAVGDVRPITQSVAMAVGRGNYAAIMINKFLRDQILSYY